MSYDYQYQAAHNPPQWDTAAEKRLLYYLQNGMNRKEIARAMGRSHGTVSTKIEELVARKIWDPKAKLVIGKL